MNEKLLREFISKYLTNMNTVDSRVKKSPKSKEKGLWDRIKSFFSGENPADAIVDEWREEIEFSYGFELPPDLIDSAKSVVQNKFEKILQMSKGDAERAKSIIKKGLTKRYSRALKELESRILDDEEKALDM